mgnify:FL=1
MITPSRHAVMLQSAPGTGLGEELVGYGFSSNFNARGVRADDEPTRRAAGRRARLAFRSSKADALAVAAMSKYVIGGSKRRNHSAQQFGLHPADVCLSCPNELSDRGATAPMRHCQRGPASHLRSCDNYQCFKDCAHVAFLALAGVDAINSRCCPRACPGRLRLSGRPPPSLTDPTSISEQSLISC